MPQVEQITQDKWLKLVELSDAIYRARQYFYEHPTYANAVQIQNLERQRTDLRATVGFTIIEGGKADAVARRNAVPQHGDTAGR